MVCPHCQQGRLIHRDAEGTKGERYVCSACASIYPLAVVERLERALKAPRPKRRPTRHRQERLL